MLPNRLVREAGVDFDPADGGRLRASTQAIAGSNTNALEVLPILAAGLMLKVDVGLCVKRMPRPSSSMHTAFYPPWLHPYFIQKPLMAAVLGSGLCRHA
jgi:hypothetical protein